MNSQEGSLFINIGERCNVAGSKKFCRLIKEGKYEVSSPIALVFLACLEQQWMEENPGTNSDKFYLELDSIHWQLLKFHVNDKNGLRQLPNSAQTLYNLI